LLVYLYNIWRQSKDKQNNMKREQILDRIVGPYIRK
jgi:hypothetical protein